MRVRVELRRNKGEWLARFRPQAGFPGELVLRRVGVHDREVCCLTVKVEPRQGFPEEVIAGPELYDFRLTDVLQDQLRFAGFEIVERAWHAQQWDCFVLPGSRWVPPTGAA